MNETTMEVTSLEQLKEYSRGQKVELPAFAEDQPFVARLKRPSMMVLAATGKIPNRLMNTANNLFLKGAPNTKDLKVMPDMLEVLEALCEACFVEPTYKQIKDAGVSLTDDQMMFVFVYSQKGVKALDNFREQSANSVAAGNGAKVQREAVVATGESR